MYSYSVEFNYLPARDCSAVIVEGWCVRVVEVISYCSEEHVMTHIDRAQWALQSYVERYGPPTTVEVSINGFAFTDIDPALTARMRELPQCLWALPVLSEPAARLRMRSCTTSRTGPRDRSSRDNIGTSPEVMKEPQRVCVTKTARDTTTTEPWLREITRDFFSKPNHPQLLETPRGHTRVYNFINNMTRHTYDHTDLNAICDHLYDHVQVSLE